MRTYTTFRYRIVLGVIGSVNITVIVYAILSGYVNPYSPALIIGFAMIFFGWLYASGLPPFNTIKSLIYSKGTPESSAILTTFSVLTMVAFGLVMFRIFGYLSVYKITIMLFSTCYGARCIHGSCSNRL